MTYEEATSVTTLFTHTNKKVYFCLFVTRRLWLTNQKQSADAGEMCNHVIGINSSKIFKWAYYMSYDFNILKYLC